MVLGQGSSFYLSKMKRVNYNKDYFFFTLGLLILMESFETSCIISGIGFRTSYSELIPSEESNYPLIVLHLSDKIFSLQIFSDS